MITFGSKLFYGLCAVSVAGFIAYAWVSDWDRMGMFVLGSLAAVFLFFGSMAQAYRDADVPATVGRATSAADAEGVNAAGPVASPSVWPMVGGFGLAIVALGLVLDYRLFIAGMFVLLVVVVEWMVKAWADRASGDPVYNAELRDQIMHPIEFPVAAAAGAAIMVLGVSRVLLALPKSGSTAVFIFVGALVLLVAVVVAARPRIGPALGATALLIGAAGAVAAGIAGAAVGERKALRNAATEETPKSAHHVSDKAAVCATITLSGNRFNVQQLTLPKALTCSILFENDDSEVRNLVVDLGNAGKVATTPVKGPKQQLLTVTIKNPGVYTFTSEGGPGPVTGTITVG